MTSLQVALILVTTIVCIVPTLVCVYVYRRYARVNKLLADGLRTLTGDLIYQLRNRQITASSVSQSLSLYDDIPKNIRKTFTTIAKNQLMIAELLNTLSDGVIVLNSQKELLLVNKAARDHLAIDFSEDLSGMTLVELTRDSIINSIAEKSITTSSMQVGNTEIASLRKHLIVSATPLDDSENTNIILTINDYTQTQLLDSSQREFVSNVSHELRNPLASIKAMVETLESGTVHDTSIAFDFLGRISSDIERMTNLVNDLLELSRIESGRLHLEKQVVDLPTLIKEITSDTNIKYADHSPNISTNCPDAPLEIYADEERIRQIFINLIENAIRFTNENGAISVGCYKGETTVEIYVQDNGIGIPVEHQPHIFERFYKVERSRRYVGTGLGLAIAKEIIEAHSGNIRVESAEEEGTTFYFTLPLHQV